MSVCGLQYDKGQWRASLFAPGAWGVSLVGEFNNWDPNVTVLEKKTNGVFESTDLHCTPREGQKYKFVVSGKHKIDPYAKQHECSGHHNSIVSFPHYQFTDSSWMQNRGKIQSILELDLNMFKGKTYSEIADHIIDWCHADGYNYVELLPIFEHTEDKEHGYHAFGFFAPTSRYGSPDDFRRMVDKLHGAKIGIVLDFIPYHFGKEEIGLKDLFGSEKELKWGGIKFDLNRVEVQSYLLLAATYWIGSMHIDAIRIDAVEPILECKSGGQFLRKIIRVAHELGVKMIAEDTSHGIPNRLSYLKYIGFDFVWNTARSHLIHEVFRANLSERKWKISDLERPFYFQDRAIALHSHDDHWHSHLSLSRQDTLQYIALLMTFPGEKLVFAEGPHTLCDETRTFMKEMNHFAVHDPAMQTRGFDIVRDLPKGVFGYYRFGGEGENKHTYLCLHNMSDQPCALAECHIPEGAHQKLSTDDKRYGGEGRENLPANTSVIYWCPSL